MIVVKVELWPGGDQLLREQLGVAYIANDGTGTPTEGNYSYVIRGKGRRRELKSGQGTIEGFKRKRESAWDLLGKVLDQFREERAR